MKKVKVFILHFAGGNKYSFRFLQEKLNNYETIPLELPGRGARFGEQLIYDFKSAKKDILSQIKQNISAGEIFMIYGHSMGAKLGFYVIYDLENEGVYPKCFIATGNPGPGIARDKIRYNLPDDEFIIEVKKLGGTSSEFFENEELYSVFSPIIRSDFQIVEEDDGGIEFKIKTPTYAIMGDEEEGAKDIMNWLKYCNDFQSKVLPGDHFFIFNHSSFLANLINEFASL